MHKDGHIIEGSFGEYGGRYIPETLVPPIDELEKAYSKCQKDPSFKRRLRYYLNEYAGRPTPLYFAENLSHQVLIKLTILWVKHYWLKRWEKKGLSQKQGRGNME